MLLFSECPCALAVNQKRTVMIVTAYCHLLSEGLRQENEKKIQIPSNLLQVKVQLSTSLEAYFKLLVGIDCPSLQDSVLHLLPMPCSSPTRLPSFVFSPFHLCCTCLTLGVVRFTWSTPNSMDFASVPVTLGSRYVQEQLKDCTKTLFLHQGKASNVQREAPLVRGGISSVLLTSYEFMGRPTSCSGEQCSVLQAALDIIRKLYVGLCSSFWRQQLGSGSRIRMPHRT